MAPSKTILLLTASHDPHASALEAALACKGVKITRFDVDQITSSLWCNLAISPQATSVSIPESLDNIEAVLYRRLAMVRSHRMWQHIPEKTREFAVWETEAALLGVCGYLKDVPWINHYTTIDTASNKPTQLFVANQTGMSVPDTLITNSPNDLLAFYDKHNGKVIYKPLSINVVHSSDSETGFVYTTRLNKEHLKELERVKTVPGIFQEEVSRKTEIRVTVVDDQFFVAEVNAADPTQVDWRRGLGKGTSFRPYSISENLKTNVLKFMKAMDLRYGAFDFIIKPDGTEVFLEVNPQGAYLWLEECLGFPITSAIANALCRR